MIKNIVIAKLNTNLKKMFIIGDIFFYLIA